MSRYVLDASALLALINQEPGSDRVQKCLSGSIMSAVNVSEVVTVLIRVGIPKEKIKKIISSLVHSIIPFDEEQAFITGYLYIETQSKGLSFGDRACISLGQSKKLTVLTADQKWSEINFEIKVEVIR